MAFGDVLAGLAKASHEHQLNLMQMDHENAKAKANLLVSLANNPNYAPEQQEQFLKGALLHLTDPKKAKTFDIDLENNTIKVPIALMRPAAQPSEDAKARELQPGERISPMKLSAPSQVAQPDIDPSQFDTKLSPDEEQQFQVWKQQYAPKDSGYDYDLRGAFKAGLKPSPTNGHWPDTFKKPNHPTFSDQSKYAGAAPDLAGSWDASDNYIPGLQAPSTMPGYPVSPRRIPTMPGTAEAQALPSPQPPPEWRSITQPMSLQERDARALRNAQAMQEIQDRPTAAELARIAKEQADAARAAAAQEETARHNKATESKVPPPTGIAAEYEYYKKNLQPGQTLKSFEEYQNEDANRKKATPGEKNQGYRDRLVGTHTFRDYFEQSDPSTVTFSTDLGALPKTVASGTTGDAGAGLSDDAVDMLATQFAKSGVLPAMGMGSSATAIRNKVYSRAAQLFPKIDVASNKAEYTANQGTLTQLTKSRDAVKAFEGTALKNLDIFLEKAKGIVDSGSPWVNTPLRLISSAGLGSADLAAYNAARQVAINEIAKVTSNPNLTGVLTQHATEEISKFIPESATLAQVVAVAEVLKQDMENRTGQLDEQIKAIRGRIGTGGGNTTTPPVSAGGVAPEGTVITNAQGEKMVKRGGQWVKQ